MSDTLLKQVALRRLLTRVIALPLVLMLLPVAALIWQITRLQDASRYASVTLAYVLGLTLILSFTLALVNRRQLSSLSQTYEQSLRVTQRQTEALQQQATILRAREAHLTTTGVSLPCGAARRSSACW